MQVIKLSQWIDCISLVNDGIEFKFMIGSVNNFKLDHFDMKPFYKTLIAEKLAILA